MKRKDSLKLLATSALFSFMPRSLQALAQNGNKSWQAAGLSKPAGVYISWAAHDELSDNVPLTEELAMKEFEALVQLKKAGAQIDYYLMDMFWFDKHEGFRAFKKEGWPNGPDRWLDACKQQGIKPGLWLPTNITGWSNEPWMLTQPEWKDSAGGWLNLAMSLHTGGFLSYHIESMQQWYDKGVRMFKFDFAGFDTATSATENLFTAEEIRQKNEEAWFDALKQFRLKNPEVVLLAYNGYGGNTHDTYPKFKKTVKLKWLEVFDSLYCGDPRPADVPCMNFWRSKDIYSDHAVFQYQYNGVPLDRIDNTAFMIGTTGTCYFREKQAWKGMLILSGARGGWMNTYYGNMDLLDEPDRNWFAKAQRMFFDLQEYGRFSTFGAIPGTAQPYGFKASAITGSLYTVVNPSQQVQTIELPESRFNNARLQFTDAGFKPQLSNKSITLGPEQMALVGFGSYADKKWDLGIQSDVLIPQNIRKCTIQTNEQEKNKLTLKVNPSTKSDLRFIFKQTLADGKPVRITGGSPPKGLFIDKLLSIKVQQNGKDLSCTVNYNKQIWSGLSWAVAELRASDFEPGVPLECSYTINKELNEPVILTGEVYELNY